MTKQEAHAFLNAARAGMDASRRDITLALYATGDLGALPREPKRQPVPTLHQYPFYATETGKQRA